MTSSEMIAARKALVPWLGPQAIATYLDENPPQGIDETRAIIGRAHALSRADLGSRALLAAIRVSEGADVASRLSAEEAALVSPLLAREAGEIMEGPLNVKTGVEALVTTIVEPNLAMATTSEGESLEIYFSSLPDEASTRLANQNVIVDMFEDGDGDWVASAIRDGGGNVLFEDGSAPRATTLEAKMDAARTVLVLARTGGRLDALAPVWDRDLHPRDVVEVLVEDLLAFSGLGHPAPPPLAAAMRTSHALRREPDLFVRSMSLLSSGLTDAESEISALAEHIVEATIALDEQDHPSLRGELARARALAPAKLLEAIREQVQELDTSPRLRATEGLLIPLDPRLASEVVVEVLNERIKALREAAEDAREAIREEVDEATRVLGAAVEYDPAATKEVLGSAKYSQRAPDAAGELLRLFGVVGRLDRPVHNPFLRVAAPRSKESARAALEYGLIHAPLKRLDLEAVLTGVARRLLETDSHDEEIAELIALHKGRTPITEQLGLIASAGSVSRAADLAVRLGIRGNLEQQLFTLARRALARDLPAAKRRFNYARAWRSQGKKARQVASRALADAFDHVGSGDALKVVLEATLGFFRTPDEIPKIGELRSAGLKAVDRVSATLDPETQTLVTQAMEQLRWNVASKQGIVGRIQRAMGL